MASPRTRRVLQELKNVDNNDKCFECNTHAPQVIIENEKLLLLCK